ncbi:MAG: Verru_Chthon cassette protein C [Verrucomicrobiota bacterium]|nr:Verru_Chthon cassette protein C [Verrucomicrobiota bacterium]
MRAPLELRRRQSLPAQATAFTLIEMLVSCAVLMILVGVVFQISDQTSRLWRSSAGKIQAFQEARAGFESMTRKLSQATLNAYFEYYNAQNERRTAQNASAFVPHHYARQSELHFISGPDLLDSSPATTHAVFFQAPLGYAVNQDFKGLDSALNACGYFLQFSGDRQIRPPHVQSPERHRYRLMEMPQRTEDLAVYDPDAGGDRDWFTNGLNADPPVVRVLADNIVALVLWPKLSPEEDPEGDDLTQDYLYDSRAPSGPTRHQLPPLVQVAMVAIDEPSAIRMTRGEQPPDFGIEMNTLFNRVTNYAADLETLRRALSSRGINYRTFSTSVSIREAKWSKQ